MRPLLFSVLAVVLVSNHVLAAPIDLTAGVPATGTAHDPWQVSWLTPDEPGVPDLAPSRLDVSFRLPSAFLQQGDEAQPTHAAAIDYSEAYQLRRKIHKYASFATLPLFAVELALGQSLYNPPATTSGTITTYQNGGARKAAHAVVGAGIVSLFAVNTVTGAWNMFGEGWSDTDGRTRRLVHGLLMMTADVGFLATTASGPNSGGRRGSLTFTTDEATHRNMAVASIGVATVGYLLMLFGSR